VSHGRGPHPTPLTVKRLVRVTGVSDLPPADWYTDPYWTVDAYVTFRGEALSDLLRSTEFSIVANNLRDTPYLSAITENAAWLGAPRTISMTTTISF